VLWGTWAWVSSVGRAFRVIHKWYHSFVHKDAIFSGPEDPGPRTRDRGPRIEDRGLGTEDPGPRTWGPRDPNWHTLYVYVHVCLITWLEYRLGTDYGWTIHTNRVWCICWTASLSIVWLTVPVLCMRLYFMCGLRFWWRSYAYNCSVFCMCICSHSPHNVPQYSTFI